MLAVALVIVAVGVYLPPPLARATLILAIVVAAVIWVVGEAFGAILTGGGTDPNSGPLLALLALAYWPVAAAAVPRRAAGRSLRSDSAERVRTGDIGMSIPAWILDIFAAVMLLVAAVSAGQLVVARAWTRAGARDADIAGSHLLMGIAMAGMLVASLSTLPNAAWEAIFAVMTAWFAWCLWRESRGHGRRRPGPAATTRRTWCTARRCSTCSPHSRARLRAAAPGWPAWRAVRPAARRPCTRPRWRSSSCCS